MYQPPVNILRAGRAEESPASSRRLLRAGPLSLVFDGGDLRYLRYGEREVIRRVYVAVRDQHWNTVAPQFSDLRLDAGEDHFHATFQAIHRAGELDFRWRGEIRGSADGTITYLMDGAAHSTFWRNRIGCCVLHPMRECANLPCVAEKIDGSLLDGRFPAFIAPHQPFIDLRALSYEVAPGVGVEVRCEGDTFEMEDQRNWSDASFKTYSTPLSLPRPAEVPSGARIVQQITIKLCGHLERAAGDEEGVVEVTFDDASASVLPRLGIVLAKDAPPLGAAAARRLRALNLSHLRVDCEAFAPNVREAF
ncbi:MAG TPA: hypothetical protein VM870_05685, partial [Pyrinomonadaceae bacterium]|nr:hypothetical protein [Pyrinomonadaceae bacterium]